MLQHYWYHPTSYLRNTYKSSYLTLCLALYRSPYRAIEFNWHLHLKLPFRKVSIQIDSNTGWTRVCNLKWKFQTEIHAGVCVWFGKEVIEKKNLRLSSWLQNPPCSSSTFCRCCACTHTCDLLSSSSLSSTSSLTSTSSSLLSPYKHKSSVSSDQGRKNSPVGICKRNDVPLEPVQVLLEGKQIDGFVLYITTCIFYFYFHHM